MRGPRERGVADRAFVRALVEAGLPRLARMKNTNASQRIARTATASITLLLLGAAAQAQSVRKCQVDGRFVYQSSPCPVEARVASATPQAAAAEPMAAPKKKTLADLLRERDGADRGRPPMREAQGDGANVLRSRMGAV
jgi:hypothetical protein